MSENRLVRVDMLKSVMKARNLVTPQDLADAVGYARYTYWRDLLNGTKSFGEKTARRIEASLKPALPRGYLDGENASAAPSSADDQVLPLREREPDLLAAFRLLDERDQGELLAHAGQMVAAKHGPTMELMKRLKVDTRADDVTVNHSFEKAEKRFPRKQTSRAAPAKTKESK